MVATLTFHWATNYGAVLQSFALQRALLNLGLQSEIIDYKPIHLTFRTTLSQLLHMRFNEFVVLHKKEKRISHFRQSEMKLSKRKYRSNKSLHKYATNYECVICGSDQIWNQAFCMKAEGGPTLSYFLDFCNANTKRIAYAASWGSEEIPMDMEKIVVPHLRQFKSISVRENTGLWILNKIGIEGELVADPTILLDKSDYEVLVTKSKCSTSSIYTYILHDNQRIAPMIRNFTKNYLHFENDEDESYCDGVYDWLNKIKCARIVITNSFHCVVMSLIFHTNFIAIPVEGSGMNDRITTLMKYVGLENRIVDKYDEKKLTSLLNSPINFQGIDRCLDEMRLMSYIFLKKSLSEFIYVSA